MLERTFGRVSRSVDKAPRLGRGAKLRPFDKQRRSGCVKWAAASQSKPPIGRLRAKQRDTKAAITQALTAGPLVESGPPEATASPIASDPQVADVKCVPPDVASLEATIIVDADEAAPAGSSTAPSDESLAPVIGAPQPSLGPSGSVADAREPAARRSRDLSPRINETSAVAAPAFKAHRHAVLNMTAFTAIAAACILSFGRFSEVHIAMPPFPIAAIGIDNATPAIRAGAPVLPLLPGETIPPARETAAYGSNDLMVVATLPPSPTEQVTAHAVGVPDTAEGPSARTAPRKFVPKQPGSRANAPHAAQADTPRRESSRGPIMDFLNDLIP